MRVKDIPRDIVFQAKVLWQRRAIEEYKARGDIGSCILGDGICVYAVPKGCRLPQKVMLIRAGEVACCQGSIHYESCKDEVIAFLRENGVDAVYDSGWMD